MGCCRRCDVYEYCEVDAQLLLEVRQARYEGKPLPVSLIRVLASRGWARDPFPDEVIVVRAVFEEEPEATVDEFSQELAVPSFTFAGIREIALHIRIYPDELFDESMEWDDEEY